MRWISVFVFLIAVGCSALEGEQKSNVNDIIKSHEIKRVSKTEILIQGEKIGHSIASQLDSSLQLSESCVWIMDQGILNQEKENIQGEIKYGFEAKAFNSAVEQSLFGAYDYNMANSIKSSHSIQHFDEKHVLFTSPIIGSNEEKANCDSLPAIGMWSIIIPTKTIVNSLD